MAALKIIQRTVNLDGNSLMDPFPDPLPSSFFNDEREAHVFRISARRSGSLVNLSGNVEAMFLNDNGETVYLSGSIVDGSAVIVLSNACYQVVGSFTLTISVSDAVIYECVSSIKRRSSDTAYDPTGVIPNMAEIQAAMAGIVGAENLDIDISNGVNESTITVTGRDGVQKTATIRAVVGDDYNDLKAALEKVTYTELFDPNDPDVTTTGYIDRYGALHTDSTLRTSGYIPYVADQKITSNFRSVFVLFYDTSKVLRGVVDASTFTNQGYVSYSLDGYARFAFQQPNIDSFSIYIATRSDVIAELLDSADKASTNIDLLISGEMYTQNLYDPNDADVHRDGYYNKFNGTVFVSSETLGTTGFIPYKANQKLHSPVTNAYVIFYDANKAYLGYVDAPVYNQQGYVSYNADGYVRFIFITADESNFWVRRYHSSEQSNYVTKTGVAFGTSLTYRAATTGGYLNYLPGLLSASIVNNGVGNSKIMGDGGSLDMLAKIQSTTVTGYDFCLLEGFVNDWGTSNPIGTESDIGTNTVCGCVYNALSYLMTNNPHMKIFVLLDHFGNTTCAPSVVVNGLTQYEYYEKIAKRVESMGVQCVKVYALAQVNNYTSDFLIDNIHPSLAGALRLANAVYYAISGWRFDN